MDRKNLRDRAESELQKKIETLGPENMAEPRAEQTRATLLHLLHELQVYEQELEIQNQDLRKTQMVLEESRDRYSNLFDFAPVGYLTLNEHGVILEINLCGAKMLGQERRYLLGLPFVHFVIREDRPKFLAYLSQCRKEHRKITEETLLVRLNGDPLPVQLCTLPIAEENGGTVFRTALLDIAERRAAEAELRKAHQELERRVAERTRELQHANDVLKAEIRERERLERELLQRMNELAERDRRKNEFLAMLSHELRNPLSAIVNAAEVARRKGAADPVILDWSCRVIRDQSRHLAQLLNDLLDVARVTQGKIVLHRQAIALASIIDQAVESNRAIITERSHRVTVVLPPQPVHIDADPTRCVQIVGNLIHNAAKFTEPGGDIRVVVEREGGETMIRVQDTGMGIPPEKLSKVFDLFHQEDRSLDRSLGGLGIGLALVRKLAEMHGGQVEARSPGLGNGSEFVVRLPALPEESRDEAPDEKAPVAAEPKPSVLVVDDNADSADSLSEALRSWGFRVETAYSGKAALAAAEARAPGVILLDIGMPEMDGYETARRLRERPGLAATRLIALTGYGAEADQERGRQAGFDGHLVKPVNIEALLDLLK
jgi:PAS domain S-box-containing protein